MSKMEENDETIYPVVNSYTEYADGHIEIHKCEPEPNQYNHSSVLIYGDNYKSSLIVMICLLSVVSVLLLVVCVFCIGFSYIKIDTLNTTIANQKTTIENQKQQVVELKDELSLYTSNDTFEEYSTVDRICKWRAQGYAKDFGIDSTEYYNEIGYFYAHHACIVTPSGKKYHKLYCSHINDTESYMIFNIKTAIQYGYEKCSDCY